MNLTQIKKLIVGALKGWFPNKLVIDKLSDNGNGLLYDGSTVSPVGQIITMMATNVPIGYLKCDGSDYLISDYPALAAHILSEFGSYSYFDEDSSCETGHFTVPDLRGEFLRGTGTADRSTGNGAEVGEHQDPTKHIDILTWTDNLLYISDYSYEHRTINPDLGISTDDTNGRYTYNTDRRYDNDSVNGFPYSYITSRPTNTSVLYCIKY